MYSNYLNSDQRIYIEYGYLKGRPFFSSFTAVSEFLTTIPSNSGIASEAVMQKVSFMEVEIGTLEDELVSFQLGKFFEMFQNGEEI